MFKKIIKRFFRSFGYEITKNFTRRSVDDTVKLLQKQGLEPLTIIDVGAATGTTYLLNNFPMSHHFLIEPLIENEFALLNLKKRFKNLDYKIVAVGKEEGNAIFYFHEQHFDRSSFLIDNEKTDYNKVKRKIEISTLNKLVIENHLIGPYIIKLDTQGTELDILLGASSILQNTECIIIEVSFYEFYKESPIFADVITFMNERNFVVYDITDFVYRPYDTAIAQVDLVFVKKYGMFRKTNQYN